MQSEGTNRDHERALAEARQRRERTADELYSVRRSADPERHRVLEAEYNRANAEVHKLEGARAPYRYQRDAREDFTFEVHERRRASGSTERVVHAQGELSDPSTVINWRKTEIGQRHDARLRSGVSRGTGDDAGHIVACEFGVDPAERMNVSRQNPTQNQHGNWRAMEERAGRHCKLGEDRRVRLEVQERYLVERYGRERAVAREVDLHYGRSGSNGFRSEKRESVTYANTKDYRVARQRTGETPVKRDEPAEVIDFEAKRRDRLQRVERAAREAREKRRSNDGPKRNK